jgi:hypothetical protein
MGILFRLLQQLPGTLGSGRPPQYLLKYYTSAEVAALAVHSI